MTSATIATDLGDIEVDLFTDLAPKASQNFIDLARKGFYDDVVFHRVIPGFVAQAGDGQHGKKAKLDTSRVGTGGPGYTFADEPVKGDYVRGSLAMANAGPNTNGSQFFICTSDLTGKLPKNYTLFGQVTKGMDVVDQIVNAPRNSRDLPNEPVAMTSVTIHGSNSSGCSTCSLMNRAGDVGSVIASRGWRGDVRAPPTTSPPPSCTTETRPARCGRTASWCSPRPPPVSPA